MQEIDQVEMDAQAELAIHTNDLIQLNVNILI